MENLQQQHATLRKLNAPSEDPIGAAKVLEMRTDKVNNDQFQMNARLAETFLSNSELALGELAEVAMRAKEIAIGQASGASSNEDTRLGVSEEVKQLHQQAVATANRRIGDRYLFGGFKTNRAPVTQDGKYVGDAGQMTVEVGRDVFISMNVAGIEAFNTHPKLSRDGRELKGNIEKLQQDPERIPAASQEFVDSGEGGPENVNLFGEIENLRIGLLTGDLDAIRSTLDRFDQVHGRLTAMRAKIGSRLQGLQSTSQALERHNLTNAQLSSSLEDADMAQVVSDLAKEETLFKSALSTSQKLIQPTLLDFLK
jgi:flagellar hook-associated protein 3 FlgL